MLTDVKIQCMKGQGEPRDWVTALKGGVQALMGQPIAGCGPVWSCALSMFLLLLSLGKKISPSSLG